MLTVRSFLMLVVAIPTLFLARRFYSEVIGRWIGRTVLRIWGIDYTTHYSEPLPDRQTIYISNHTSTLDVLLLISLGLPRARFFLSGYLRKFPVVLDHRIHHSYLLDRASGVSRSEDAKSSNVRTASCGAPAIRCT